MQGGAHSMFDKTDTRHISHIYTCINITTTTPTTLYRYAYTHVKQSDNVSQ